MDIDAMKRVNRMIDAGDHRKILDGLVMEYKGKDLTEYQMLQEFLEYHSKIVVDERVIPLPNFLNNIEAIIALIADWKKEQAESRLVKSPEHATTDDLIVYPLMPCIFHTANTYAFPAAPAGAYDMIPLAAEWGAPGPFGIGNVTGAKKFVIDPTHCRIILTDFVDVIGAKNISKLQYDIDDKVMKPVPFPGYAKFGNVNVIPLPSLEVIKINMYLRARIEFAANIDFFPCGIVVMKGEYLPVI